MAKYEIRARRTHWYEVIIEAADERAAIDEVRDWIADDWEDLEVQAEWDFDATEMESE